MNSFNNNSFVTVTISTILTNNNSQDDTLLMVKEWAELMQIRTGECPNYTPTLPHLFTAYVEAGRLLDEQQARQLAERKEEEASNKEALWLEQVENRLEAGERVSF
jgi:uncharacterized protein Yka (UPF0111/DUF47 family)